MSGASSIGKGLSLSLDSCSIVCSVLWPVAASMMVGDGVSRDRGTLVGTLVGLSNCKFVPSHKKERESMIRTAARTMPKPSIFAKLQDGATSLIFGKDEGTSEFSSYSRGWP